MTQTNPAQQSQTALDLWNQQIAGLTNPAQSESAMNIIYERLMKLHGNFVKNEMPKQAGQTAEAYNLALSIFNDLQAHQTLVAGGAAAIEEANTQRQQALDELRMLVKCIEGGDESHPKLSEYASSIRADEREDALSDPYLMESVYEGAVEQADEYLYEMIMETWDVTYVSGDAVIALLVGNSEPTDEQRDLIRKLFATTQSAATKRDPLASVVRNLGGHSADDTEEDS
jgi:hypothetical protein